MLRQISTSVLGLFHLESWGGGLEKSQWRVVYEIGNLRRRSEKFELDEEALGVVFRNCGAHPLPMIFSGTALNILGLVIPLPEKLLPYRYTANM